MQTPEGKYVEAKSSRCVLRTKAVAIREGLTAPTGTFLWKFIGSDVFKGEKYVINIPITESTFV